MRTLAIAALGAAALVASPALAQGRSGGHAGGGMGGGVGNPMGAGAPAGIPGWNSNPRGSAQGVADSRGAFGRDFAQQRQLTQAEQAKLLRDRAEELRLQSANRKADAMTLVEEMRSGHPTSMSAKDIRRELKEDMEEWRDAFNIGRQDWQSQRDQWLVDRDSLTPEQWAERRAMWFDARDAWIKDQVDRAQAMAAKETDDTDDEESAGG